MFCLLRAEGVTRPAALFGGLAFELMPKLVAHAGAGHLTLMYAIPLTPWLLWTWRVNAGSELTQTSSPQWKWLKPGLLLALIFLADVRWAVYAGIMWWGYAIAHSQNKITAIRQLIVQSGLAVLLAAPLALPLLEYAMRSTRGSMTPEDILAFSLPPARLLGLIFPDFGGFHEWVIYSGAVVLCLNLALLSNSKTRRGRAFWLWVALISLLVALGSSIPGFSYLARLPGLSLMRVPSRALFLIGFAMAVLAAWGVDILGHIWLSADVRKLRLGLFALAGFAIVMAIGVRMLTGNLSLSFAWGAALLCAVIAWLLWGTSGAAIQRANLWFAGLLGIALLDWGMVDRSLIAFRPADEVLGEQADVAQWLAAQEGLFRVYSPSYSIPQQTAARLGIELADGVDPMQLESYAAFMERATGVPRRGYSVTIPPFASDDPETSNAGYVPDTALLGLLNVRYIASSFDLSVKGLEIRANINGIRLYENMQALPRAWVQPVNTPPGQQATPARILDWRPDRISVEASGPGELWLAEIMYPGWRAFIDGEEAHLSDTELLRKVQLEPGMHRIDFVFVPTSLYMGLGLCLVGVLFIILPDRVALMRSRHK
jgi:hypothetical protein